MSAIAAPRPETGALPGGMPYVKIGGGQRALAILPGFGDAMFSGVYPPFTGWALTPYFTRYLGDHTVYLVSRPRGLPPGYDPGDAVETHTQAFTNLAESSTGLDVVGISMGGLIGQALAHRRPDLVDRLVLANSACRLAEEARPDVRRLEKDAREHDWFSIRSELARAMYSDVRAFAYPPIIQTVGRLTLPRPAEPADVWRSLEFILEFDSCDRLESIEQPTLVFGGENDPYFTPEVTRETADGLPSGELTIIPGARHAAFHERKSRFDSRVQSFFRECP